MKDSRIRGGTSWNLFGLDFWLLIKLLSLPALISKQTDLGSSDQGLFVLV